MNLHDYLKISKCGYSKVTDHVCREIRHKRITREHGINLIKHYENIKIENLDIFAKWLDVDSNSLNFVLNRSKNEEFWQETDINKFEFKGPSSYFPKLSEVNKNEINYNLDMDFVSTNKIDLKQSTRKYILFGKGIE